MELEKYHGKKVRVFLIDGKVYEGENFFLNKNDSDEEEHALCISIEGLKIAIALYESDIERIEILNK